jgi:putative ABC transport system permease protein
MELALLAGRNLSDNVALDRLDLSLGSDPVAERALVARGANMLLNESASRKLGFARPADAIGKTLPVGIVNPENGGMVPATVVGVVADAQFRSMRETIEPMSFFYSPLGMSRLVVRYSDSDPAAVRARLEQLWRSLIPDVPFQAEFADDAVAELYAADLARGQIFAVFAGLSVIVGCLGLFGLAAFTAERRTKEIGIRKVLGARTRDIVQLLVWQFSKPVVAANHIAWPVAWWAMRDWLNGFSDRIDLGPGPFLLAGLLALAIAIGTIAGHALKVARANPIHALRYE